MDSDFMLGYDYTLRSLEGLTIPIYVPLRSHLIVVGGSGSGKSTAVLYWLYKARKYDTIIYIVDFKASHEFEGISRRYAEFEDSYLMIKQYYEDFLHTPEGGDGRTKILLIDEIMGLLTHYGMTKEGKLIADEIRNMMSTILMLGRSRNCFLWLSMQRYSATIFPASSGSADNFHVCIGLGVLSVDGRRGLFSGEKLLNEEYLLFGQGRGIVLVEGQCLRSLIIPHVSKRKLLELLQKER